MAGRRTATGAEMLNQCLDDVVVGSEMRAAGEVTSSLRDKRTCPRRWGNIRVGTSWGGQLSAHSLQPFDYPSTETKVIYY